MQNAAPDRERRCSLLAGDEQPVPNMRPVLRATPVMAMRLEALLRFAGWWRTA